MATNTTHCYDMPTFDMTMPMTHTGVATNTMIKPERASSMLTTKLDTLRHVTVCLCGCHAVTMRKLRKHDEPGGSDECGAPCSSQSATPLSLSVGPECQIMTCLQLVANSESD